MSLMPIMSPFRSGFDLSSASYEGVSFDASANISGARDFAFGDNGAKMYLISDPSGIVQYGLSVQFNVGTASLTAETGVAGSGEAGITLRPDGSTLYVAGEDASSNPLVRQYALSTAWLASSRSLSKSLDVSASVFYEETIRFSASGSEMYILDVGNDRVRQFDLSTAWDIASSTSGSSFSVEAQDGNPTGVEFRPDGEKMFIVGGRAKVFQYTLSTPWDISTASYDSISFDLSGQMSAAANIRFKPDGLRFFVLGNSDVIYQYSAAS